MPRRVPELGILPPALASIHLSDHNAQTPSCIRRGFCNHCTASRTKRTFEPERHLPRRAPKTLSPTYRCCRPALGCPTGIQCSLALRSLSRSGFCQADRSRVAEFWKVGLTSEIWRFCSDAYRQPKADFVCAVWEHVARSKIATGKPNRRFVMYPAL